MTDAPPQDDPNPPPSEPPAVTVPRPLSLLPLLTVILLIGVIVGIIAQSW